MKVPVVIIHLEDLEVFCIGKCAHKNINILGQIDPDLFITQNTNKLVYESSYHPNLKVNTKNKNIFVS